MRIYLVLACAALAATGCKKTTGGGGGGGSSWLVGAAGLMTNVDDEGQVGRDYPTVSTASLNGIACRYLGEAWVVGDRGTLLYTNDGGTTWTAAPVPTSSNLRALATQDAGPVFVAGDGAFLETTDTGATWHAFGDGTESFRSVAAAQAGSTVLALGEDGGVWSFDEAAGALAQTGTLSGAHAVAVSPDGSTAYVAGAGLWRSRDAGASWTQLAVDPALALDAVNANEDGGAVAVGAAGAIVEVEASGAIAVQHAGNASLHALHIADADDADAMGFAAGDGGEVWITRDSGVTWQLGPTLARTVLGVDQIGTGHN
jgi:photosystem II stability/assembly factor-like uncharacterized protein